MVLPYENTIYFDEYLPLTAELEIVCGEIIKKMRGNPRLHAYYFKTLAHLPTIDAKLFYSKNFLKDIENWRVWVDKNLHWITGD